MIATDALSLVFIACFLVGLLYFVFTAILGNLGHGMTHHVTHSGATHTTTTHAISNGTAHTTGHVTSSHSATQTHESTQAQHQSPFAFINPTSIMLFLLGFGFFGYFFHNTIHAVAAVTLVLAGVAGIVIAALLLILLSRLFGGREESSIQDVSDRTGLLGKVSITIQENGLGEIIYISPAGMRKTIPARSIDGHRLERDQEVVVVNYQHGIAEVDTWEHFVHEDGIPDEASYSDELEKLRNLLDASNTEDSQFVMKKDLQKE
jgi:hypothetical protein